MRRAGVRARVGLRPGFTLIEVVVVLLIMTVATALTVPAFLAEPEEDDMTRVVRQLDALFGLARDSAVRGGMPVTVMIDSATSHVWMLVGSTDPAAAGDTLDLPAGVRLQLTKTRATFSFVPHGAVFADSVRVRTTTLDRLVTIDPWTGHAVVH